MSVLSMSFLHVTTVHQLSVCHAKRKFFLETSRNSGLCQKVWYEVWYPAAHRHTPTFTAKHKGWSQSQSNKAVDHRKTDVRNATNTAFVYTAAVILSSERRKRAVMRGARVMRGRQMNPVTSSNPLLPPILMAISPSAQPICH